MKGERPEFEVVFREDIETLMQNCWHPDSKQRPSFFDICYKLEQIIEKVSIEQKGNTFNFMFAKLVFGVFKANSIATIIKKI